MIKVIVNMKFSIETFIQKEKCHITWNIIVELRNGNLHIDEIHVRKFLKNNGR